MSKQGWMRCCCYVQGQTAIYRIRWLCILHCHMCPPSSKRCPCHAASLHVYEGAKSERNCPGNGGCSVVKWEMNVLKDWSKGILQIPETGTNCPWQRWTGPAGCEGGSDLTVAQSNCVQCMDVGISAHGTLITGLEGPIPCGCRTVSKTWTGGSVWVGWLVSPLFGLYYIFTSTTSWLYIFLIFFSNLLESFLEFFDFVGEILCGCWTISKMPTGVGAGDVVRMTGFVGAIPCGWQTVSTM